MHFKKKLALIPTKFSANPATVLFQGSNHRNFQNAQVVFRVSYLISSQYCISNLEVIVIETLTIKDKSTIMDDLRTDIDVTLNTLGESK